MVPAMKPRTVCFCQPILAVISARVAPLLRCSIATTWAVLLPSRVPAAFLSVAFLGGLAAPFAGVAFWCALALAGAPLAACALTPAFRSGCGFAGSPRCWMRAQIRLMAALALLKPFSGFTPG